MSDQRRSLIGTCFVLAALLASRERVRDHLRVVNVAPGRQPKNLEVDRR